MNILAVRAKLVKNKNNVYSPPNIYLSVEPINSVGNIKEAGFEDKLRIKMACRPKPMIE